MNHELIQSNIPKIIYLIWLGNNLPMYLNNVLKLYKDINPSFDVKFLHFSINDILHAYNNVNTSIYSNQLRQSISFLLNIDNKYNSFILEQKRVYGKNIRAIQILSDIFRLEVINQYGGIYVDCDTIPLKPFDEELLSYDKFIVTRHYDTGYRYKTNVEYIDNYFIGSTGKESGQITNLTSDKNLVTLLQTQKNWYTDIFYKFRKQCFYKNKITLEMIQLLKSNTFYVEHYYDNNWNATSNRNIKTPRCFLDNLI